MTSDADFVEQQIEKRFMAGLRASYEDIAPRERSRTSPSRCEEAGYVAAEPQGSKKLYTITAARRDHPAVNRDFVEVPARGRRPAHA